MARKNVPPPETSLTSDSLGTRLAIRYEKLCLRRDGWRNIFTLLSRYVLMRPAWYGDTSVSTATPRLTVQGVSDDKSVDAARTCATALGGALWPNRGESFELVPKMPVATSIDDNDTFKSEEVKNYCARISHIAREKVDSAESGFEISRGEHFDDTVVFGTSGIYGEEDEDNDDEPFTFRSISVETCVIDEAANGKIDTIFLEYSWTARRLVQKFGYENCSKQTQALYDAQIETTLIKMVHAIYPRENGIVRKGNELIEKTEKKFVSVYFEVVAKQVLDEGGMDELPAWIVRFRKRPGELYGRSLAMDALPSIKELNILRKSYSAALEKILAPPLGFYSDQFGGAGQINLSPGATNQLYDTGRIPQQRPPVVPLITVPEPQVATQRMLDLTNLIDVKFLLDKLLDFNNKTRMTLGEADKREDLRNQMLGSIFSRQIVELFHPLVKWAVKRMWARKMLGLHPVNDLTKITEMRAKGLQPLVMPKPIADLSDAGDFPFHIRFISPAARSMADQAVTGVENLTNYALALNNGGHPEALDCINVDEAMAFMGDGYGAPARVMNGADTIKKIRSARQQAQQAQIETEVGEAKANIAQKTGKAANEFVKAGMPAQAMGMAPGLQQGAA